MSSKEALVISAQVMPAPHGIYSRARVLVRGSTPFEIKKYIRRMLVSEEDYEE